MDGLRTYFKIIDGQNHNPTPNIFHKMQKSLDFIKKKKRWINLKARTKRELKYPTIYLANLPSQPKHLGYFGKKHLLGVSCPCIMRPNYWLAQIPATHIKEKQNKQTYYAGKASRKNSATYCPVGLLPRPVINVMIIP